jgi:thiamine biosynthesis protein ThiS
LTIMVRKQGCQPSMIEIVVNGDARRVKEGQTLADLLKELELDPERVAIEMDRKIVKQPNWSGTVLHAGNRVEIVQFVGGG